MEIRYALRCAVAPFLKIGLCIGLSEWFPSRVTNTETIVAANTGLKDL